MKALGGSVAPKAKKTFTVLIPALNEEKNIGGLLDDIFEQELGGSLSLEKVIVVSDGSTDRTDDIVRARTATDARVELLINPSRMGKPQSLNVGKREVRSDFLVLLDGDVRLNGHHALSNLLEDIDEDVGLVGGNPVPAANASIAALASRCGDIVRNNIMRRIRDGSNIYSAHGRIMALSKSYYSTIEVPIEKEGKQMVSEDQYLYLSCIRQDMRYVFRGEAEVRYNLPTSFKDYLRQSVRFMYSIGETKGFFNDRNLGSEYHVPFRIKVVAFVDLFRQEPLGGLVWTACRIIGRLLFLARRFGFKEGVGTTWEVSESTKDDLSIRG